MKLNDLLKGKTVNIMTDAKVVVQLKIQDVVEKMTNDFFIEHYSVQFENDFIKTYPTINDLLKNIV